TSRPPPTAAPASRPRRETSSGFSAAPSDPASCPVEPVAEAIGNSRERFAQLPVVRRRRLSGVAGDANAHRERDAAEEILPQRASGRLGPARTEWIAALAAVRAKVPGHIFDQADHGHVRLAEQVESARGIDQ